VRVVHIITGLDTGGAEMMLLRLLERLSPEFEQQVISLTGAGPVADRLKADGIPVMALGMSSSLPDPFALIRLVRHLRRRKPNVVQTWLYHADLVGGIAARLAGVRALAWNIRNNDLSPDQTKTRTRVVIGWLARLSGWLPARIVCCSKAARKTHEALGYDKNRFAMIPNGFDLQRFKPDLEARASVRAELGIPSDATLVGLMARLDPQKNHAGFLVAAGLTHRVRPEVHFLLAGRGVDEANMQLASQVSAAGVEAVTHMLGERHDVPRLTASLDIAALASWGEAFPNVLGEAMACGVPCVATDAGDSAFIIGDTGRVVPRGDMVSLAHAWLELLDMPAAQRTALGAKACDRVAQNFDMSVIAGRYAALYREIVGECG
jgi:glycosyltransferase involved in cell wall biosynthesis